MFTENEVAALVAVPGIQEATFELKKEFLKEEAPFLEISDHDFLSLVILTPSIGIALANGSVSLFEEISLNKKARKLSKGGYFMKKDPVVVGMGYLIKKYSVWSDRFCGLLRQLIDATLDVEELKRSNINTPDVSDDSFCLAGLQSSFIFIRYITSFFLDDRYRLVADAQLGVGHGVKSVEGDGASTVV